MHKAAEYALFFFVFRMLPEFYWRILDARFALLVSQSVNFTIGITFLADEKKQPLNNTSPLAGCTLVLRYQLPEGATAFFTTPSTVVRELVIVRIKKIDDGDTVEHYRSD